IGLGAGQHIGRHPAQLGVDVAAIVEQAGIGVVAGEAGAERLGQPAHLAAMRQVDLEQPVACDDIALAEERIGDGCGADVRRAPLVVDDLDRGARAAHTLLPDGYRAGSQPGGGGATGEERRAGAQQE
ncbi:hypothetical protein QU38_00160, partial [Staphylococcus aureus]